MADILEVYTTAGTSREMFTAESYPEEYLNLLKEKFSWFNKSEYTCFSSPVLHSILEEEVITAFVPYATVQMLFQDINIFCAARKFCLKTNTSFIRGYSLEPTNPAWLPEFCKCLAKGINYPEFGRSFPPIAATFKDYYFSGDAQQVESYFNLPENRGKYETFYAATVSNEKPIRIKQYMYDEQDTFSDWDVKTLMQVKLLETQQTPNI